MASSFASLLMTLPAAAPPLGRSCSVYLSRSGFEVGEASILLIPARSVASCSLVEIRGHHHRSDFPCRYLNLFSHGVASTAAEPLDPCHPPAWIPALQLTSAALPITSLGRFPHHLY